MLKLNINSDDSNNNDFLISWSKLESRPNQLIIHNSYLSKEFNEITKCNVLNTTSELIPSDEFYLINDRVLSEIKDNILVSYVILDKNSENSITTDITFFYKESNDLVDIYNIIDNLEEYSIDDIEYSEEKNGLGIISIKENALTISKIEVDNNIDINLYYSKETAKNINKFLKKIKKTKNGISVFYGDRGTGKTSIIKKISSELNKNVFFIPNNLIDQTILNPEFINFLTKYKDCVLVIDDFEIIIDNFNRYNSAINSINQITESLLSELVDVNIILIFNTDNISEIPEITESNNLIDIIKFNYLNPEESNNLANSLGRVGKYKNNSKVLDIIKGVNLTSKKRVGF
jgi:predicted AAA+ superfamily ATPase